MQRGKELNLYTGLLSILGILAIADFVWQLPYMLTPLVLIVTLTCIALDFWPLNMPDGLMWNGGVIGFIFVSLYLSIQAAIFALVLSTSVSFITRSLVTRRKTRAIRFLSTLGMYCISLVFSHWLSSFIHLNFSYFTAFIVIFAFEICNLMLLLGIEYSLGLQPGVVSFLKRFNIYTIIFGSLAVGRFLTVSSTGKMFEDLIWTALMLTLLFIMSNRYANAASAQRQSESKYQIIAQNTSDLIAVVTAQGSATYASPSHNVLGRRTERIEGQDYARYIALQLGIDAGLAFNRSMERALRDQTVEKVELVSGDGSHYLESVITPVINIQGHVTHLIVVSRDITDRRKTEELLRQSEKLAVVGKLAAGVAHEIRNPLTVLKGFLQVFRPKLNEYQAQFSIVWNEVNRIEEIISEFLMMSKPEAHRVFDYNDPNHTILEVAQLLGGQANFNGVEIVLQCGSNVPAIYCHQNSIKQMLMNVMKNAIEAMPEGGRLEITSEADGQHVFLRILDTGHGIAPEMMTMLGEPFYTTKDKGTGLGLMVTYKIIRDHGGDISIDSTVGKGTTVTIRLPIEQSVTPFEQQNAVAAI